MPLTVSTDSRHPHGRLWLPAQAPDGNQVRRRHAEFGLSAARSCTHGSPQADMLDDVETVPAAEEENWA